MIVPKKGLACYGRVMRISNRPRKVGRLEHVQTVCTRLFSKKEPRDEATNKPATRLQIEQLLLELYSVVKKKARGFY